MKLGFIGTGTIASAMVEGLMKSNLPVEQSEHLTPITRHLCAKTGSKQCALEKAPRA